ncbi:MAG: thiamine pyrophosphate-dependent dehydrogenase E1 component subunit alpha [Clostridia bacterium]|nr:thiamine pyrophosphate-dependent dehydrogenase E1 component subunit alpha [Clostridia bacterium]
MMRKIRMTEEKIAAHYREDNMHTPIHLCIGEEATAVGVCFNLSRTDKVFSNHRNHGHYLAKGGNLKAMIAELHNKASGCSGGFGGSMHLVANDVGFPITSSIVAGGVPIGTGNALAQQMTGSSDVTIVYMGDAASEEGVVYESIAFAVLKKLPIVYICENNLYSVGTPLEKREAEGFISNKFTGMLPVVTIDGNDVLEVQRVTNEYIEKARGGEGPAFIECRTYRFRDHHDTKTGVEAGYQTQEEWDSWKAKDPILRLGSELMLQDESFATAEKNFETEWKRELQDAFSAAAEDSLPKTENIAKNLFA